ncbi:MAG: hypothetical protein KAS65_11710, partial [Candidatus Aminicenantes bacterium]|nr:hypothetical protein [Candidatus Aminicenantes bacterium]
LDEIKTIPVNIKEGIPGLLLGISIIVSFIIFYLFRSKWWRRKYPGHVHLSFPISIKFEDNYTYFDFKNETYKMWFEALNKELIV